MNGTVLVFTTKLFYSIHFTLSKLGSGLTFVMINKNILLTVFPVHSPFRGSVNCWAPLMENFFQVAKFVLKVKKKSFKFFCLVQKNPGIIWVACIGLRYYSKWSLGCARAFLEAFLDLL